MLKIKKGISDSESDEQLLERYRSTGDMEIPGILYSRYMHLVYGVCLKYLNDREESKDAVMLIFEKLLTELPRHKIENFRGWLHVVAKNHCLMQLRSGKTENAKREDWLKETSVFMEYEQDMHPLDSDGQAPEKALEDCIERLREEQKRCITMFYYEDRCYNEIAEMLDLDEKRVKSHLQNGKRNLKICLEEKNVGKEQK